MCLLAGPGGAAGAAEALGEFWQEELQRHRGRGCEGHNGPVRTIVAVVCVRERNRCCEEKLFMSVKLYIVLSFGECFIRIKVNALRRSNTEET